MFIYLYIIIVILHNCKLMTLSKSEEIKNRKRKITRLYLRSKHYIIADKELLSLAKLTKAFFQCKSMNATIKEVLTALTKDEVPFDADDKELKMYRDYVKQYKGKN